MSLSTSWTSWTSETSFLVGDFDSRLAAALLVPGSSAYPAYRWAMGNGRARMILSFLLSRYCLRRDAREHTRQLRRDWSALAMRLTPRPLSIRAGYAASDLERERRTCCEVLVTSAARIQRSLCGCVPLVCLTRRRSSYICASSRLAPFTDNVDRRTVGHVFYISRRCAVVR
ncbi:hypothetical protein BKA93DRAFT_218549 [Sparassis latifolia]